MKARKLTGKSKFILLAIFFTAIMMTLVFLYTGHFFLPQKGSIRNVDKKPQPTGIKDKPEPVSYRHLSEIINGNRQEINLIEADVSNPEVKIIPVLSHDLIYGFELLSSMAKRKNAYAAINGGFFSIYGLPSGMVVIDGKLITKSDGKYPVFYISEGKAGLSVMESRLWLQGAGGRLEIDEMNKPALKGEYALYTPDYGFTNRARMVNSTIVIRKGVIIGFGNHTAETEIPEDGMLVTLYSSIKNIADIVPFKIGDKVELLHEPQLKAGDQAYECGSWIVRDGRSVIGDKDAWVGVLTNQDPRTAIGVKADGKVILMTVDGRQPGFSAGMTGRELAEFLLEYGVINAAMLDGGASTEMLLEGKLVNRPSFKGQECPLAGGILIQYPVNPMK